MRDFGTFMGFNEIGGTSGPPQPPGGDEDMNYGLFSGRPAASVAQDKKLYFATDTGVLYGCVSRRSGYAWVEVNPTVRTLADVDFTTLDPTDFKSEGPGVYTLGGVPFTFRNTTGTNRLDISEAKGLCLQGGDSYGGYGHGGVHNPSVSTPLLSLAPELDPLSDDFFIVAHITSGGLGHGAPADQQVHMGVSFRAYDGLDPTIVVATEVGYSGNAAFHSGYSVGFLEAGDSNHLSDAWDDTLLMLSFMGGNQTYQWAKQVFDGEFPAMATMRRYFSMNTQVVGTAGTPTRAWDATDLSWFMFYNAGVSGVSEEYCLKRLAVYAK